MKNVQVIEVAVLMNEQEADSIFARLGTIMGEAEMEKFESYEWSYLYDLTEDDKVIAFVSDDLHQTYQIDVVQFTDGSGYAFNFWKGNYFYGQIVMDNTWNVTGVITD